MSAAMEFSVLNRKCGCTRGFKRGELRFRRYSPRLRFVALLRAKRDARVVEAAAHDLIARDSDADDQRNDE